MKQVRVTAIGPDGKVQTAELNKVGNTVRVPITLTADVDDTHIERTAIVIVEAVR